MAFSLFSTDHVCLVPEAEDWIDVNLGESEGRERARAGARGRARRGVAWVGSRAPRPVNRTEHFRLWIVACVPFIKSS